MRRTLRLSLLVPAGAICAPGLVLTAGPATAHNELVGSSPAAGARLRSAPGEVRLDFGERLNPDVLTFVVTGPDGTDVTAGPPSTAGTGAVQPLQALPASGPYQVSYRVVSADGHPVTGSYAFVLDRALPVGAAATVGPTPPAPAVAPVVDAASDVVGGDSSPVGPALGVLAASAVVVGLLATWRRRRLSTRATSATGVTSGTEVTST